MKKIIRLTEDDLMKIVKKVIKEAPPVGTSTATPAANSAAQTNGASVEYGMLVGDDSVNKVKDSMTGAKTTQVNQSPTNSKVYLFKDENQTQNVYASGYNVRKIDKTGDGKITIKFDNFSVTTDCTRVSKNDKSFDYQGGKYYSQSLLDNVKPQCK